MLKNALLDSEHTVKIVSEARLQYAPMTLIGLYVDTTEEYTPVCDVCGACLSSSVLFKGALYCNNEREYNNEQCPRSPIDPNKGRLIYFVRLSERL